MRVGMLGLGCGVVWAACGGEAAVVVDRPEAVRPAVELAPAKVVRSTDAVHAHVYGMPEARARLQRAIDWDSGVATTLLVQPHDRAHSAAAPASPDSPGA